MIRALALPLASCLILCLPLTAKVPASQAPMTQAPAPQAVVVKPPVSKKGPIKVAKPKPAPEAPAATGSVPETAPAPLAKPRVQLLTSYGPIVVELEPELALTTVAELAENPIVQQDHRVLHEAARVVASPQLRNMGTVGGNLCQRPRCWYYRDGEVLCTKRGGTEHKRRRFSNV